MEVMEMFEILSMVLFTKLLTCLSIPAPQKPILSMIPFIKL